MKRLPAEGDGAAGRRAAWFVWLVWAVMSAFALAVPLAHGRNVPLAEDWHFVPALVGDEPHLGRWLWEQNNEHRVPLPKLLLFLALKATGGDFRTGMALTGASLVALAAVMIWTAGRLRGGRVAASDAFFPLVLLHLGHWDNLGFGWQFTFVLPVVLAGALLLCAVSADGTALPPRNATVAGACLVALPLCGANGLVLVPPMALWLGLCAVAAPATRRQRALLLGCITASVLLSVAYFVGYVRPSWVPPNPGPVPSLRTAGRVLALGLGPAARVSWPVSVPVALAAVLPGVALTVRAARAAPSDRVRAWGLLLFFGGMAGLVLAVGWGRAAAASGPGDLPLRYAVLCAPAFCASYFAWLLYAGTPRHASAGTLALCLLAGSALLPNTRMGLFWRDWYGRGMAAVERDVRAGLPDAEIAARHRPFLLHWNEPLLTDNLGRLRSSRLGPFRPDLVPPPAMPARPGG